jgi:hypothetical protein
LKPAPLKPREASMFFNNEKPPRVVRSAQGLGEEGNVKRSDNAGASVAQATAFPPGLIGEVANYIRSAAPHPNDDIALAGAIAFMSGVCGKAYNTYTGAGLNQYILLLASTGMGKEAASNGISKLFTAIIASVPAAGDFKGPALVSSAGLLKWLDKKPSVVCIIGEFGYKLKAISSPKANPNDEMLKATLLDLYGKSGAGSVVDPMAYSDKEKNTGVIIAPALTVLGESVPGIVYEAMTDSMVLSGLLPRFIVIEAKGKRSQLVETAGAVLPDPALVQRLADLCGQSLTLAHQGQVYAVPADEAAKVLFRQFGQWVTDQINSHNSEVQRELWNRAHLKSLKLAALCAVGINPTHPLVTIHEAQWATDLVASQTRNLLAKFDSGEVGEVAGDEVKQLNELIKTIATFINSPFEAYERYGGFTDDMHRDGIVTGTYLSRRLIKLATFRNDRIGATNALNRALKSLLESDELREVPKTQMQAKYGSGSKAYVVANPTRFVKSLKGG